MLQLEMCASVHALLITPKRKDKGKVTCVCTTDRGINYLALMYVQTGLQLLSSIYLFSSVATTTHLII